MAGLIRRSDIDEVRSRTNLADIVGDYVTLKSAGSGSMKGLCPFHEERSPSFHVRPQVGFYHCFGCQEGGDVFSFLMKMDHVSFSEAVERMAARIGFELHYEDGAAAVDHGNRARILAANQSAAEFFVAQLSSDEAEPGRAFLGARGFDQSAAERFGIGFAPRHGALGKHLRTLGYKDDELVEAGLLGRGDRGDVYDRFRGRLVWPIRDTTGATLGFGARKLLDDDQGPKYLNTPETPVYHKSQVLYGLDLAKKDIARGRQVVVVEGYTDVMACHLAGVTTAVATCGTAFGVDHIKMIRRVMGDVANDNTRGTGEVIFTFDPDAAGQKAASRAFEEEQRFAAQTFVAVAPDGLDPCDLRLNRGDDAVRRLVSTRKPMFEFMIRRQLAEHNLDTVEGRVSALRAAAPVVAGIRDQALSVGYIRNLAGWLGVDINEVGRAVTSARKNEASTPSPSTERSARSNEPAPEVAEHGPSLTTLPTDPATRLERDALMAILQHPTDVGLDYITRVGRVGFADNTLSVVRDGIATSLDHVDAPDWLQRVADEVPVLFSTLVKQLGVAPIPQHAELLASYCKGVVASLLERDVLRRKRDLMGSLQRLDATADPQRYEELQRELVATENERRALRE
ncbi:DNA primase [Glaciihabitans arcticus]|uniref:DNA primase n=1 Tax=Glaciihabitans arcticus TaxID=2668039 RepID=A0A4Q9GUS1_9MICO|nr:DNA primase [Glaciihabitans arcticus]TBN56937.1 DNA primase [Glaciihabitans arcticus]